MQLLYIDLDQFKVVNDTCGHTAGDELLRQVSHIINENTRQADPLALRVVDGCARFMSRIKVYQDLACYINLYG